MNLLETTKLCKIYGDRTVVNDVSFTISQQEVVGLLGRNGAGKTTTFRMILGMVVPDSGAVAFDGRNITHLPMYRRCQGRQLGYLSQERSDFRRLTVWQNLQAILETVSPPISRAERNRRANMLLEQYGLMKCRDQKADTLSGGERRKLEISRALVTDPKLILLDEPFSGVDPRAVEDLQQEVLRLKHEFGKSVLITDHNVAQTLKVCDRALIIADGKVMAEGTPREVINDPRVREAYTGNLFRGDEFDPKPSPKRPSVSAPTPPATPAADAPVAPAPVRRVAPPSVASAAPTPSANPAAPAPPGHVAPAPGAPAAPGAATPTQRIAPPAGASIAPAQPTPVAANPTAPVPVRRVAPPAGAATAPTPHAADQAAPGPVRRVAPPPPPGASIAPTQRAAPAATPPPAPRLVPRPRPRPPKESRPSERVADRLRHTMNSDRGTTSPGFATLF